MKNPFQPFEMTGNVVRFRRNKIVEDLLDFAQLHGFGLNQIAMRGDYTQDDYEQFMQLIGYSLCGFHEISRVSDKTAKKASKAASKQFGRKIQGCRDTGCEIHIGVEEE